MPVHDSRPDHPWAKITEPTASSNREYAGARSLAGKHGQSLAMIDNQDECGAALAKVKSYLCPSPESEIRLAELRKAIEIGVAGAERRDVYAESYPKQ